MKIRSSYRQDMTATQDGVWFDFPEDANPDGTIPGYLLSRFGVANPKFEKAVMERAKKQEGVESLPDETKKLIGVQFFVDFSLQNWRNVQDVETSKPVEFSKALAVEVMNDPEYADLYDKLQTRATTQYNYRHATAKEISKN